MGPISEPKGTEPYALAGDSPRGDYLSWTPDTGSHSLTAVALDSADQPVDQTTITFQVIEAPPQITIALTLVNAVSDADIGPLVDNQTIDLSQTGSSLNIRADVQNSAALARVRFILDGAVFREEGRAPYALAGDDSTGDYLSWTPATGSHDLTVVALDADSNELDRRSLTFQVIADSGDPDDRDGDGIPDAWESQNGLDPQVDDAGADLDGDGLSNLNEFLIGTDPGVAGSPGTRLIYQYDALGRITRILRVSYQ